MPSTSSTPTSSARTQPAPGWSTWDDHEVDSDYAAADPPEGFLRRRPAAYQAYWEHMPLRPTARPRGPVMRLYQRVTGGGLVEMSVLDTRQYPSDQPCGEGRRGGGNLVDGCAPRLDPAQTMVGPDQERWLLIGLARSRAGWNVIAQPQPMAELRRPTPAGAEAHWTDGWDGYPMARRRLLDYVGRRKPANPVVIGGDVHSFWVTDLKPNFDDPASPVVATEIVGTSTTSQFGRKQEEVDALKADNPHLRFANGSRRGYVRVQLTPQRMQVDLRAVRSVTQPRAPVDTLASFVVDDGRPGAQRA